MRGAETLLTSLELCTISPGYYIPSVPTIMIIPTLTELKILNNLIVLGYIQTPALLTLTISYIPHLMPSLGLFMERSRPPLTYLSLCEAHICDSDLAQLVISLPELSYLSLKFVRIYSISDAFLRQMEMASSTSYLGKPAHPPLPNLQEIYLSCTTITCRGLIDFLESRRKVALAGGLSLASIKGQVLFADGPISRLDCETLEVRLSTLEVILDCLTLSWGRQSFGILNSVIVTDRGADWSDST